MSSKHAALVSYANNVDLINLALPDHRLDNPAQADQLRVARDMVELPDDLAAPADEPDTVDSLTACLPRVLYEEAGA